jgi:hypothetical protein
MLLKLLKKYIGCPTYPIIAGRQLHDGAPKGRDTDHRMAGRGAIPDENPELSTRNAIVGSYPSMSEVTPNVG